MNMRTTSVALAVLMTLGCGARAFAAGELVHAEIASASPSVRSGAPITIVWKVTSQSNALLEGRLELTVRDGVERIARLATDDMVISNGEQFYRMVLPPLDTNNTFGAVEMRLRLVGPQGTIGLGDHTLRLPSPWQRSFVVAISDPWQSNLNTERQAFLQQFRFETYNAEASDRTISTIPSHVRPDDMSADPLGYCGFDLVLLMHEGLAELKDAQCQALTRWVASGGSLCIVPGRTVFRPHHVKFLSDLAPGAPESAFLLDSTGRLSAPANEEPADLISGSNRILLKRRGLGRVAVVRGELTGAAEASTAEQRRMLAFLWKMRKERLAEFEQTGKWTRGDVATTPDAPELDPTRYPTPQEQQQALDVISQMRPRDMQLAPIALQTGDQLLTQLMPRNLKIVPLKLIGVILVAYVLVIGPGDYFLLGALKRRRYTWVLFPAVTVGFAMGTVWLSNWYMRITENRRSVSFLDVGDNGGIVRRSRFEVLFQGAQGDVTTQVARGLLTAMNHQRFSLGSWSVYNQQARSGTADQFNLVAVPDYAGRVPTQYQVTQFLPQWTPQLNRLLTVAPEDEPVEFDWSTFAGVRPPENKSAAFSREVTQEIVDKVRGKFGAEASVFVARGQSLHTLVGTTVLHQQKDPQLGDEPQYYPGTPGYNYYAQRARPTTFLQDVCVPWMQGGLFNVVSQISPNGGRDFEDLALLDSSDSKQWLLLVVVERGDNLAVYRKLYTGEP